VSTVNYLPEGTAPVKQQNNSTNSKGSSNTTRGRRAVRRCAQVPLDQHRLALRPVLTIASFGDSALYHSPVALELYSTSKRRESCVRASAGRDAGHFVGFEGTVRPATKQKIFAACVLSPASMTLGKRLLVLSRVSNLAGFHGSP
jgi:hypothetical protein